ncbi:MAG: endonuclease MutS2 [Peptoniphilus harei]|uniref:endonuclease MutS2 n=1 Tax=Peptoniphilus harei TaxID=54005 RepID=UPI00254BF551|nr:endonuclease MutS2 [Peptoniphilus harei]MDK7755450.1 endonuclease MutS2 [Peptoniphilus harei]MDK7761199.1 endonuclease MutS2 [Peptoniphilus harei]MDK8270989.1 endonuclease MutS2 [Peptoniphilus harei]MDK8339567.1 endonuclease MutS2 [Peptoniphilus harei]
MDNSLKRASKTLEFDKVLVELKKLASASITSEYIDQVEISTQYEVVKNRLNETHEALKLIIAKGEPQLFGIVDIRSIIKRTEIGGALTAGGLLQVSDFLRISRGLKTYLKKDSYNSDEEVKLEYIDKLIEDLYTDKRLEDEINSKIISEEEIADDASRELLRIRRGIVAKKDAIKNKLNGILSSHADFLQDAIVTLRDGRYVVPVKIENKSRVKGLVHDISGSGQTAYIEPMAVVEANNDLKELYIKENLEIEKILKELSELVGETSEEIKSNQEKLIELDFIFAKARLGLNYRANMPKLNREGRINLIKAYHPFLDRKIAVPIDINLGIDFTSLIVTGPNTGGKTVSIKTVGLLTLMTQFGLLIPADEASEIAVFEKVFADIGDEQSIEQSLSTFSSHMVNIVYILKNVTPNSLVLFDELGAGTDPTEGAALARSIMDFMLERKIRCISTSHYNQLKIYALTTDGVANASMEFDVDSLSPTYRLLIGVPGKSNAFEISRRLGLPDEIIGEAKKLLSSENIEFEDVLQSIDEDRTKIREYREELEREKIDLEKENKRLQSKIKKLEDQKEKILEKSREEAKRLLLNTKENVDIILSEINEARDKISSENSKKIQEAQDLLRESIKNARDKSELEITKAANPIREIKVGDKVRTSLGNLATVLELPDKKGNVLVQSGIMKMNMPKDSLTRIDVQEDTTKNNTRSILKNKATNVKSEIDIRGKNFEDAKDIVDKYLDDAYLSGLKSVRIIHGKGTGVLRQKLREHFRNVKLIKSYKDAEYNEGGDGVTVVTLK